MTSALRRYEFSERLAEILGESRRDLRFRVTLMISGGLVPPGPRGPGSPLATPDYAANLLIGVMAAPAQVHTVDAIRCYRELRPTAVAADAVAPHVVIGQPQGRGGHTTGTEPLDFALFPGRPRFGEALARLIEHGTDDGARAALDRHLFGVWLSRGFPVAAVQLAAWWEGRRTLVTQRYELPQGARPPAWLDPERGSSADPGLFHSVFLPVNKLIEIATLVSPQQERKPLVLDLAPALANLADLARNRRHRRSWEKFLSTAAPAQDRAERIDVELDRLVEVTGFGSNAGNLRMLTYLPDDLPPQAPLVVVLHGCTQTARAYDLGTGWTALADRYGFALLLPEQRGSNNPLRCFNWFRAEDNARSSGEAATIVEMVDHMVAAHGLDRARVFVTGVSAGGAMTSVMLATYPDVFAGGAVIAGVPYRCANGLQDAFEVIFQGRSREAAQWGDLVRGASPHQGPWPKVSVWHGDADGTVKPLNAQEVLKQWTDVHGLPSVPTSESVVDGHPRRVWHGPDGREVIEFYSVVGMAHGVPIDPDHAEGSGTPAPFILDAGIPSTYHIAKFWGLTRQRREVKPAASRPQARPQRSPAPDAERIFIRVEEAAPPQRPMPDGPVSETPASQTPPPGSPAPVPVFVVDAAGQARADRDRADRERASHRERGSDRAGGFAERLGEAFGGAGQPGGIDLQGILTKSFELAGIAAGLREGGASGRGRVPGVDLQGILTKSFEIAGLAQGLRDGARAPQPDHTRRAEQARDVTPPSVQPEPTPAEPTHAGTGGPEPATSEAASAEPAAPAPAEPAPTAEAAPDAAPAGDLARAGWESDGWVLVAEGSDAQANGAALFGYASSGIDCDVGEKVRSVSRRLFLGQHPRLSYVRRLDLSAAVNVLTTASFTVLVESEPVDEVSAVGMTYAEAEWTERADIDLTRYAGRSVTLTFQVAANSNLCMEVFAKAWLRGVSVRDAGPTA